MDEAVQPEEESPPDRHKLRTRAGVLEYTLSGEGPATIVLLNGAGVTLEGWSELYPDIESIGRVFAWNRFGLPGSDEPAPVQNGAVIVASVRELMAHAGLEPPYVLVGHSLGGLYANLFARGAAAAGRTGTARRRPGAALLRRRSARPSASGWGHPAAIRIRIRARSARCPAAVWTSLDDHRGALRTGLLITSRRRKKKASAREAKSWLETLSLAAWSPWPQARFYRFVQI